MTDKTPEEQEAWDRAFDRLTVGMRFREAYFRLKNVERDMRYKNELTSEETEAIGLIVMQIRALGESISPLAFKEVRELDEQRAEWALRAAEGAARRALQQSEGQGLDGTS